MNLDIYFENCIKLKLVELGAGVPLTNSIISTKDSSKVLIESYCPYGTAKKAFNIPTDIRMVSKEAVDIIAKASISSDKYKNTLDYNMIFVSSFQIPNENYFDKIPHGWICICNLRTDTKYFFHITLRNTYSGSSPKEYYNNIYKDVGFKLLEMVILEKSMEDIYDVDFVEVKSEKVSMNSFDLLKQKELFVMYTMEDSKIVTKRFEDFSRLYDRIVVYKGSFNPFHKGHEEILERTMKACDDSGAVTMSLLVISRDTFGKGIVENLEERITKLCEAGYEVLIVETPWFYDSLKLIRDRYKGSIVSCMGLDTFSRLYKCYEEGNLSDQEISLTLLDNPVHRLHETFNHFLKISFLVFDRHSVEFNKELFKDYDDLVKFLPMNNPISSTELRKEIV